MIRTRQWALCALVTFLTVAPWSRGQVDISVDLNHTYYLSGEPVLALMTFKNRAGRDLTLASEPRWIEVRVTDAVGEPVARRSPVFAGAAPVVLPSGREARYRLDLAPFFDFPRPGRYRVRIAARFPEWSEVVAAQEAHLRVVSGVALWSERFAVTDDRGDVSRREYRLMQVNRLDATHVYLQVRLVANERVVGVEQIGTMVSFADPEGQIDPVGNAHLLVQFGRESYRYCVVSPNGQLIARQTYVHGPGQPQFRRNEAGLIVVRGGSLKPNATDYFIEEDTLLLDPLDLGPVLR